MSQDPFIRKLTLRNFRSIHSETVTFANPLFLVGRNGSGKSNFVKSLTFLSDCMTLPLQSAFNKNHNPWNSHAPSSFHGPPIEIRLEFQQGPPRSHKGHYYFLLSRSAGGGPEVESEQCVVSGEDGRDVWFERTKDEFRTNAPGINPAVNPQSLALPVVAGVAEFSPLVKALSAMRVYTIKPHALCGLREGEGDSYLASDGSNGVGILARLARQEAGAMGRVRELLAPITPGITNIEAASPFNNRYYLRIVQRGNGADGTLLDASAMSDGTLSALGLIIAAMQDPAPSLIAIEEPELNIHPGALDAIADVINMAAQRTQVIVTTHSPDLIDAKWIQPENLRVVEWENGATRISELGVAPVKALRQHLMGAGELMRANALDAAPLSTPEDTSDLFEKALA